MSWNDVLISVCSIILTAFASWLSIHLTAWLDDKLKGAKSERFIKDAYRIVAECVKSTYQTYVEAIKGTDLWTKEAQQHALDLALSAAHDKLSTQTADYLEQNFGDLDEYLSNLIEAILYDLKN